MDESEQLNAFQQELGIQFSKPDVLKSALTHPSAHEGRDEKAHREFERMEFFGDALLNFIITNQLIKTFPELDEGNLSKFRSTLVSREALFNVIASKINLNRYASVGPGEDVKSPREKAKILADITEAVLAAIYYDQGLEVASQFVLKYFVPHMTQESIREISFNAKGALQEEVQKRTQHLPDYTFERSGNKFICRVSGGPEIGSAEGMGSSKKEAAQHAAAALLKTLSPSAETAAKQTVESPPLEQTAPGRPLHRRRPYFPKRQHDHRQGFRPRHVSHSPGRPRGAAGSGGRPSFRPDGAGKPGGRPPLDQTAPRQPVHHTRRPRSEETHLDWRAWQSSQQPKSAQSGSETEGKSKAKTNWRDRIKKLTGRIRKTKS
ncbi:MAG: ribonuclease III [Candidatus Omnitrophica bacterium]|nr:ribonuclease III [Candidatus Omnitrophota bacterium]